MMDKETLLKIAEQIDCSYEPGIRHEICEFLENNEHVKKFDLKYENNSYKVIIKLADFDVCEIKDIFTSLLCFIEYTATFYVREDFSGKSEYILLSSLNSKKGFLCKIIFTC